MYSKLWLDMEEAPQEVRSYYEAWQAELDRLQADGSTTGLELANVAWVRSTEALNWLRAYWAEHNAVSETEEVFSSGWLSRRFKSILVPMVGDRDMSSTCIWRT